MAASQKLSHLLQLADQGPALRAALAEEVAELLTNWPADYPESMRDVCEALLAKAARDVDRRDPRPPAGAALFRSRPRRIACCRANAPARRWSRRRAAAKI